MRLEFTDKSLIGRIITDIGQCTLHRLTENFAILLADTDGHIRNKACPIGRIYNQYGIPRHIDNLAAMACMIMSHKHDIESRHLLCYVR